MPELELVTLPNGVRIALDPMPTLHTTAVGVWQRVGARWEKPEENGVAHLFEHMAFKGAGGRDARQFAEAIEAVGGVMNAATSYERTSYYARVLKEDAAYALDLIADTLLDPHWAPDDLEKEKGVVAQERGEAFDQPDDRVFELHQQALFPDQALGRPILGVDETLAPVSVQSLIDFRAAHMAPERVIVSVAGAFDRPAVLETITKRFGDLPGRAMIPPAPAKPAAGISIEERSLEQTHLVLTWAGPAAADETMYAARLMAEIYGGGMSSRLFQEVRETRGLVYAVDAYLDTMEDCGRLGVYAGCAAKNAKTVALIAADLLMGLAKDGPTAAELQRAKAVAGAQLMMGAEAPLGRAEARASQLFLRDRLIPFDEIRAKVDAVTAEQVAAAAARALNGPVCAAAIGPKSGLAAASAFHARFAS
ncbi:MAG: insulinase family protein [Hyphomonadaceae bacterium]|nr:insulinase family protein [Hyphomonadaceae bacterium]